MPGNRLSLAVLIGCEPYGFCLFSFCLQCANQRLFVCRDFVAGFKIIIYVDTEIFLLQIAYVSVTRKDFEIFPQKLFNRFCFCRRLDNDKVFLHNSFFYNGLYHNIRGQK